jgi:hypothetical protein
MKKKMSAATKKKLSVAAKARHAATRAAKEPSIDDQMSTMNDEGQVNLQNAIAQNAIANYIAQVTGELDNTRRVRKDKCHRHPDVNVKAGDNCPVCIKNTHVHNAMVEAKKFVLPCPQCGDASRSEDGGIIQTFYSKKGHYACAMCQIDYNVKGEIVTWQGGKSQQEVNNEILFRKRRN